MQRSIATAPWPAIRQRVPWIDIGVRARAMVERADPAWIGLAFVFVALFVYASSNPLRGSAHLYNHFVWQADAFLQGRFALPADVPFHDFYPVPGNPDAVLIPFPPLPAILLMPFVVVFGLATDAGLFAQALGAINVGLAWRMLTRVTEDRAAAVLATVFYGFGTVAWYAAMLGSTWFLAHVVASTFLFLAITAALDGERLAAVRAVLPGARPVPAALADIRALVGGNRLAALREVFDPVQFAAGFLFGLAALSRLTVIVAAPFFVLVGSGGNATRRAFSAGLGAAIPVALLVAYNLASTGHFFHPGYEHLYQTEYTPRPDLINRQWGIEDPRYIPSNAAIMLAWPPVVNLDCIGEHGLRSLAERVCPTVTGPHPAFHPDKLGMGLPLASPAYLLAIPLVVAAWRRRLVAAAVLAVASVTVVNLMHFSQGWVQFGYRFSNDFAPFALILVALAVAWLGVRRLTVGFVAASVLINAWGVYWGVALGW